MPRLLMAAIVVTLIGAPGAAQQKEWAFPSTRSQGRATVEYRNQGLQIAINYDYSQRNHKTKWLLVDLAAASRQPLILHKSDITLMLPEGRSLPVAAQEQILDDGPGITQLLQNARIWRRPLEQYFNRRGGLRDPIRFQAFPPGSGTVSDETVLKDDGVASGAFLFRAPAGSWEAGTYRLEIKTDVAVAALPIRLE